MRRIALVHGKNRKRKALAFIITISILLLPSFFYIYDLSSEYEGIAVDGEFDDWEGVESYKDSSDSPNPDIDISEYRMKTESLGTSFYLKVAGDILQGTSDSNSKGTQHGADSVRIFIDQDNNPDTGYSINGIGADGMVQIYGVNNQVKSSNYLGFEETALQDDWNGWGAGFGVKTRVNKGELETQIPYSLHESSSNPSVLFHILDNDYNEDYSDSILIHDSSVLEIKEYSMANGVLEKGSKNNNLLMLELTAHGSDTELESLTLSKSGTALDSDTGVIAICKDDDNNGYLSITDSVLTSNPRGFFNDISKLSFSEPLFIQKEETVRLFVLLDITPVARTSNSIGVNLLDAEVSHGIVSRSSLGENLPKLYIGNVPDHIIIDGAFADWNNFDITEDSLLDSDKDSTDIADYCIANDTANAYLYIRVAGALLKGTRVPVPPVYYTPFTSEIIDSDKDLVPDNIDPNPTSAWDSDGDGLSDDYERVISKTNETKMDTDGDGWMDGQDIAPNDPDIPRTMPQPLPEPLQLGKDNAYIFIDADQDPSTGYMVNTGQLPMGADYAVMISGKYGYVFQKDLVRYTGSGTDFSWENVGDVPVEKDENRLEMEINLADINLIDGSGYDVFFYISDWNNYNSDTSDEILTYAGSQQTLPKAPSRIHSTRANNPYLSAHVHPNDVANSDGEGTLDVTDLDEDANGDGTYHPSGDTNEPDVDWIEVYFPSADIPSSATIVNITYYYGYYTNDGWGLTTDSLANISWRVNATENDLGDYTLSSPPDTDIDDTLIQTANLPTVSNLTSGNFKVRFRGIEDGSGPDKFFLDYCYFKINYSIPNIVINEIMFNPSGDDNNSEWVELYNAGGSAVDLTGWNLTDNDGNKFDLSGSGSIPSGGYLVCYLAQSGTNSSTNVYGLIKTEQVIQPNATVGNDTVLSSDFPALNFGTESYLRVENETQYYRTLLQFNLSAIPTTSLINSKVWLYRFDGNSMDAYINVHRVTQNWTETGATWNTHNGTSSWPVNNTGGDYNATIENTTLVTGTNGWYSWNITDLTTSWLNGTYSNQGILLKGDSTTIWKAFYSSDYTADTSLRPKLIVEYWDNKTMLDDSDDLTLLDSGDNIIDYVAWGADAGADDDDAAADSQWTDSEFVDTTDISEGDTLGRDKDSTDTDSVNDWENTTTSKAEPFGVNATAATQGSQNLTAIPEFDEITFVLMGFITIFVIVFIKRGKRTHSGKARSEGREAKGCSKGEGSNK
jgi:hypothetical protein